MRDESFADRQDVTDARGREADRAADRRRHAPASKIDVILAEVARHGAANVRRAYGNWKSPHLKPWEATLHTYAIRPIQQFAYSRGKNASDMAMVIDAMDLLYARHARRASRSSPATPTSRRWSCASSPTA